MNVPVERLKRLYIQKLSGLYGGEFEQLTLLPEMVNVAQAPVLVSLLQSHLEKTYEQVERLNRIFARLGFRPGDLQGLESAAEALEPRPLRSRLGKWTMDDAALIAMAQAIEQHEISGYLLALNSAQILRDHLAGELFEQTLKEEYAAHRSLAELGVVLESTGYPPGVNAALTGRAAASAPRP